jgi:UDP-N-acetylglucosamine 2-epimerase (non-hydrolysing)
MPRKILFVIGTRPEAIKLSPVIHHLRRSPADFQVKVCATAQQRELLDQVLDAFEIKPDYDLGLMLPNQTLFQSTSRILTGLEPVLQAEKPDMVLVQGDTTTAFCGALAAFYLKIPVGHVEAGLRTGDRQQPFPEEINRILATHLSSLHFAPTEGAMRNLTAEGVPRESIAVTGNTGIDAVLYVRDALEQGRLEGSEWPQLDPSKKLILVTAHRRESFGEGFERICSALARLAERRDVQIVYPVHPNPNVQAPVQRHLSGLANVLLIAPLGYVPFVDLMRRCYLLLTDSGGIQEEAPSLGKPVLVLREKTERPEAMQAGTARLVGTDEERILREAALLLDDPAEYGRMAHVHNPYGDGRASQRISDLILSFFRPNLD